MVSQIMGRNNAVDMGLLWGTSMAIMKRTNQILFLVPYLKSRECHNHYPRDIHSVARDTKVNQRPYTVTSFSAKLLGSARSVFPLAAILGNYRPALEA